MSRSRKKRTEKTKPAPGSEHKNRALYAGMLLIVVITFLAYIPALKAGYIWDDDDHFTENELMNDWEGFKNIWSSSSAIYYPLVLTSFWIMRRLWGLSPLPYHGVNILIHCINAILFWGILRRLKIKGGFFAGLLFALHPVHVESAAWVTELKNTQSGLFYLASFHAFLSFFTKESLSPKTRRLLYGVSLILFIMALLSKPSTVMLPAVLFVFIWWKRGRWEKKDIIILAPFFALSLLSSGWTIWEQKYHSGAKGAEWSLGFLERLLVSGRIAWFYLGKIVFPHRLVFIYPRWEVNAGNLLWYIPVLGWALCFLVFWIKRRTWGRDLLFGFGYYMLLLFPVLGFFNIYFMRFSYVGDHFQYLATLGPIALFAFGASLLFERWKQPGKTFEIFFYGIVTIVFAILVWNQSKIYKNEETLWRDTIRKNPKAWIAYNNLGFDLASKERYEEALEYYKKALELKPDFAEVYYNTGIVFAKTDCPTEAVEYFQKALELNPLELKIHSDLGLALSRLGKYEESLKHLEQFLAIDPEDATAWYNKGVVFSQMGRMPDAISCYKKALTLDPKMAVVYNDLGNAYYISGKGELAIRQYQKALQLNPQDHIAKRNLDMVIQKIKGSSGGE